MLVTVENQLARKINTADTVDTASVIPGNPAGLVATGGNIVDPLPYPFDQVGELAINGASGDSIQRAMHISDFRRQHSLWRALPPSDEWNLIVNEGKVTFAEAAETGRTDIEEEYDLAIV